MNIKAGQDFTEQIINAIEGSKLFVIMLSRESMDSPHVKTELERAFAKKKLIFPIRLDNTPLPKSFEYFLTFSQWIEVKDRKDSDWIKELIELFLEKL